MRKKIQERLTKTSHRIRNHRRVEGFERFLENIYFRKNPEFNLYLILGIFFSKIQKDAVPDRASGIAFNLTLAIFPFVIFLFTLIPYLQIPDLEERIFTELNAIVPNGIYAFIDTTIYDIVSKQRGGLLSFGFVAALFAATSGTVGFMDAFSRSQRIIDKRNFFHKRVTALSLTLIFTVLLLLTIILIIVGEHLLNLLIVKGFMSQNGLYYSIQILRYIVAFLIILLTISMLYRFAPALKIPWRTYGVGAVLASFSCVLVSVGFSSYINYFNTYNKLYGSIGAFIGFMFWLFAISLVVLFGFEINVSIEKSRKIAIRRHRVWRENMAKDLNY
ncbi:putative membrane protein [Bernardetia litoralis DSM 6794]|uniref:Putative membrane protein n=1 Tax=Bernardetia litoralis (strain ATCC 23117 / DSM 6794 / NBRC 15988 / NCIMB 1366 / Fx l1 / Sio-4) TaxID=880071 RepID=I4AMT2_BERLS|nr:YihY/virulence factor BrkB family protein [Bernardetia litoralis]AFM05267.1 putative membrane protein [Bernardetia litoralis DSM 6794]